MSSDISKPIDKVDSKEKTGGSARYIGDIHFDGMLYAKTLRSDRVRAKIISITLPSIPDGYFIVDKSDVPGTNRVAMILSDQPYFAEDTVNYMGQPILLVVGPDKEIILEIIKSIDVEYEDVPPILTLDDMQRKDAPPIYEGKNEFATYHFSHGNVKECWEKAHRAIEAEYKTGYQEQLYIEPQGVVAEYADGRITVHGTMQCPYYVKKSLMYGFGWSEDRIRVKQTTVGGAFGGKEDYPSIVSGHAAFAAYKCGQPVQLIFDRAEDVEATPKRHPSVIKLKTALDKDNNIIAMDADIKINAGAYSCMSTVVLQRAMFNIAGVYGFPNVNVTGKAVATNTVPNSAFRGFGAPQAAFAIEMHMDHIAKRLGIDPVAYKKKHMVRMGDNTVTGGTFRHYVSLPDLVEKVDKMADYTSKTAEWTHQETRPYKGIGMSLFLHGCGFTGSGERDHINAVVKLQKTADEEVFIRVAGVDMGQGLRTTFRKIVAEALKKPVENVYCELPDTDKVPDSGPTVASRSIMIVGKLLYDAALELKEQWKQQQAQEVTQQYEHPEYLKWKDDGNDFYGDAYPAYSWGVNAVEVEIDPITYHVDIKGVWTAFDIGKAIDNRIVQGQIEGGVLQGLGYGSLEVMNTKEGKLQQRSMTDYIIPTAMDSVKINSVLVDNPYELGPFGAKGAGELTLIGAAPALATAISNALRIDVNQLPVTPEYLAEAVNEK